MTINTFPVANGDILDADSVNRFAKAGGYIAMATSGTSTFGVLATSGTALQTLGSVLIPANTLSNPCELSIFAVTRTDSEAENLQITVSGNVNGTLTIGSNATSACVSYYSRLTLGSPFTHARWFANAYSPNQTNTLGAGLYSETSTPAHLDAGSPIVIFFNSNVKVGMALQTYSIQQFRGGY